MNDFQSTAGRRAELLAPAGSYESMKAAISAGADAVYIGGSRFGARAYADNLDEETMLSAIDYAHFYGVALYMTVNTLVKEQELESLYEYLKLYYTRGLDAVIVQDLGVLSAVRKWFPDLRIHASTQMTITGAGGAAFLKEMGVSRVVTARELSLEELRRIHETTDIQIESFIHGALCYCYSGQCLLSSLIGGRSGNRGRCAQPCRLPYDVLENGKTLTRKEGQYVMSLKDLCTLDILPDILESGVYSLKIEGRMKSPRYTAGVVSVYRKYLDRYLRYGASGYYVEEADKKVLLDLFDRGGHTAGYYKQHNGKDMVVLKEKPAFRQVNQELFDRLDAEYVNKEKKRIIGGRLSVKEGEPMRLSLWTEDVRPQTPGEHNSRTSRQRADDSGQFWPDRDVSLSRLQAHVPSLTPQSDCDTSLPQKPDYSHVLPRQSEQRPAGTDSRIRLQVEGAAAQKAQNQPMTAERLEKQMRKTGGTPFEFRVMEAETDGPVFVPVQALNELRRKGLEALREAILEPYRRNLPEDTGAQTTPAVPISADRSRPAAGPVLHALVSDMPQFQAALKESAVAEIQIESDLFRPSGWAELSAACHEAGKRCVLAMPVICRGEAERFFRKNEDWLRKAGFDGFLVRSLEEIPMLRGIFAPAGSAAQTSTDHNPQTADQYNPQTSTDPNPTTTADYNSPTAGHHNPRIFADHNLYAFNSRAAGLLFHMGIERLTYPLELNSREIMDLNNGVEAMDGRRGSDSFELTAYGSLPVMVTAQCVRKTAGSCCHKPGFLYLRDRIGKELPVYNHCAFCYNIIYNPAVLSLLGMESVVSRISPGALRLQFLTETAEETTAVIRAFARSFTDPNDQAAGETFAETAGDAFKTADGPAPGGKPIAKAPAAAGKSPLPAREYTRGHMKRGVE